MSRNALKWAGAGVAAAALIGLGFFGWEHWKRANAGELIAAYTRATCVPPYARDRTADPIRAWSQAFDLGNGVAVSVEASCSAGGAVAGTYSDEPTPRSIANPGDGVYPCDLRFEPMAMRLYVLAEGPASGWQGTSLYEYDLQSRQLLRQSPVYREQLPPRCAIGRPATPAPQARVPWM
jgi:hypothetical protein